MLNTSYLGEHLLIINEFREISKLLGIVAVSASDSIVKKPRKLRIGITEPTAVCDSVCYVAELFGIHSVEVLEYRLCQYVGVKL